MGAKWALERRKTDGEHEILCVSEFTLYGDAPARQPTQLRGGRSSQPRRAAVRALLHARSGATGVFGAHMAVELVNDGPVTLLLEA
jgi:D-tyrosyl-tRNA(Tyr) deacylase